MALIDYPSQLPPPLQESYSLETFDPMVRTQMVTGRARQRIRFRSVPTFINASFIFNEAQAGFFEAWHARTLDNGIEWFNCPLQTAEGMKDYEARFTQIYDGPTLNQIKWWRYSARLELRERPLIPEGWEQFPEYWFNKNVIDVALNREWPEA
ncbi:transposase [Pseudomonas putida]|uniref:Transposase n=1 Tax=Pseudomonas putida TaxID=303 RepID=A0A1X0ZTU0_PSEPU|nr:transposase [Pseudomonas putida]ORL62911.1 transposase [Pseudomonas putida]